MKVMHVVNHPVQSVTATSITLGTHRSKSSRIRTVLQLLKAKGGPRWGDLRNLARHFEVNESLVTREWNKVQDEHR